MLLNLTLLEIMMVYPPFMLAGYLSQTRYRDPIRCTPRCKHLPDCFFYRYTGWDPRLDKEENERLASAVLASRRKRPAKYYIYTAARTFLAAVTLIPAVFYVAYCLREVLVGWEHCNCRHNAKGCHLGQTRYKAPKGLDTWILRNGRYHDPNGNGSVLAEEIQSSSAREMSLEMDRFEREKIREKIGNGVFQKIGKR